MDENSIDSLRQMAIKILDNHETRSQNDRQDIIKVQNMLTVTTCVTFLALILSALELRRKNGH
jgi:hypothetical protein